MVRKEIPDNAIELVAKCINQKSNKNYGIGLIGNDDNVETPQVFEIIPFDKIDESDIRFYAIDGSYNSEQFYNGLSIGVYAAGYLCYKHGQQIRLNDTYDPVILGKTYFPNNILITNQEHLFEIYDELMTLSPVVRLISFFDSEISDVFAYDKTKICVNLSTLLAFCQEILEIALIFEISELGDTHSGDFILRDGTLRSLQIRQRYLVMLGKHLHDKGIKIVAITKQSPIKMELAYTFKQIDNYLQNKLKPQYPFKENNPNRRKLCCWFEVPDSVLLGAYQSQGGSGTPEFIKKSLRGGRGFGLFFASRLDYVEKLQNYDWLIVDLNIWDAIPKIEDGDMRRQRSTIAPIFMELTRLTQEHYILGYPYPLAEAHNLISLKKDFKEEIIKRLKYLLYRDQQMDNVDIENLFLDMHERF